MGTKALYCHWQFNPVEAFKIPQWLLYSWYLPLSSFILECPLPFTVVFIFGAPFTALGLHFWSTLYDVLYFYSTLYSGFHFWSTLYSVLFFRAPFMVVFIFLAPFTVVVIFGAPFTVGLIVDILTLTWVCGLMVSSSTPRVVTLYYRLCPWICLSYSILLYVYG